MSSLIQHYPEAAEVVMDRCVQRSPSSITYNFRYLDPGPDDCSGPKRDRYIGLADMIKYKRQELLIHPLAKKLLNLKWHTFGRIIFIANFLLYVFFLNLLSIFLTKQRRKLVVPQKGFNNSGAQDSLAVSDDNNYQRMAPMIVTGIAVFHMSKEVYQMFNLGLRYFKDAINLLEWSLYGTALIFMLPFLFPNGWIHDQTEVIGGVKLFSHVIPYPIQTRIKHESNTNQT